MATKMSVDMDIDVSMEKGDLKLLSASQGRLYKMSGDLEKKLLAIPKDTAYNEALYYRDEILSLMQEMRKEIDFCEEKVSSDVWPLPTYTDIIFRV